MQRNTDRDSDTDSGREVQKFMKIRKTHRLKKRSKGHTREGRNTFLKDITGDIPEEKDEDEELKLKRRDWEDIYQFSSLQRMKQDIDTRYCLDSEDQQESDRFIPSKVIDEQGKIFCKGKGEDPLNKKSGEEDDIVPVSPPPSVSPPQTESEGETDGTSGSKVTHEPECGNGFFSLEMPCHIMKSGQDSSWSKYIVHRTTQDR